MKRLFFVLLITTASAGFQACNNGSGNKDSVDSAKDMNDNKDTSNMNGDTSAMSSMSNGPVDKDDADFAVNAANGSMMEVALGKMAQEKAVDQRVKDFASMMVRDHGKAGDNLKQIAASKNITLPATLGDDAMKDSANLSKKSGRDFDKAYMDMMLDDHKKDSKEFEKAATNCKDSDLRNFASTTLQVINMHLESAKAITNKK